MNFLAVLLACMEQLRNCSISCKLKTVFRKSWFRGGSACYGKPELAFLSRVIFVDYAFVAQSPSYWVNLVLSTLGQALL